ncbi:MAG: phage regulatory CII family protein [Humidesulfovibrio sp.]
MTNHPSLSAVLHAVVKKAPSGLTAETLCNLLGYKKYNTMMSELSDQPGHKLGANMVLPIMDLAESDEPMHFLARQRGGVFIKLPEASGAEGAVQIAALGAVKEFGELMGEVGSGLSDGSLSREECDSIERAGHEAVTSTMALLKQVAEMRRGKS